MKFILISLLIYVASIPISCFLFGYELKIKDGIFEFEWGLYHWYKKRNRL
jgi:hypothetical protein